MSVPLKSIPRLLPERKEVHKALSIGQDGWFKGYNAALDECAERAAVELDVEETALTIARSIFGIYAPNAKAIPESLWKDYMSFATALQQNLGRILKGKA